MLLRSTWTQGRNLLFAAAAPLLALTPTSTAFRPHHRLPQLRIHSHFSLLRGPIQDNCHQTRMASSASTTADTPTVVPGNPTWHQTMLRCRDIQASLQFYRDTLGLTHIDTLSFPHYQFDLHFLTTLPPSDAKNYKLTPGTQAAHDFLWTYPGVTLELTYNYGTEAADPEFHGYHAGNQERDGFGHIAVNVPDVYATSEKLLAAGVPFQKKPDEGRMKVRCVLCH